METNDLINKINTSMDNLDLVSARRFIEDNLDLINEHRYFLNSNARSLLEIIKSTVDSDVNTINRKEMNIVNFINTLSSKFDIRGLKMIIKNNPDLFLRDDIKHYLNADAKTILEGMNVIQKDE